MPNTRIHQRSFAGGELSPEMWGRIDDVRFQTGAATMRNFIATPQGPAENRPGTRFVREVKASANTTRLIPFTYSSNQTMVLEFGDQYVRFHTAGATLLSGGSPYEVTTPYAHTELAGLRYVQSADVLTLVHANHAPRELRRLGATNWTLTTITFGASVTAPTGVAVTSHRGDSSNISGINSNSGAETISTVAVHGLAAGDSCYVDFGAGITSPADGYYIVASVPSTTTLTLKEYDTGNSVNIVGTWTSGGFVQYGLKALDADNYYVVTAIGANGVDESAQSASANVVNNLNATGSYNTITWTTVTGAVRYNIYKRQSGLYGYIGQTETTSFNDDNIAPDMGATPPIPDTPFSGAGDYPRTVSYYEQRRIFASTTNQPQTVWMTRSGTESDISYSIPVRDTDRIEITIAAREVNTIEHIVPVSQLLMFTNSAEWRVTPVNSDTLSPTTISVRPQSYIGSGAPQPVVVNNTIVYAAARGGHMREVGYSWQSNAYVSGDLSIRASHLFLGETVTELAYAKAPNPIVWAISTSGDLLGFTYLPEQQIGAWHRHDTDGVFESCCVVAEGDEDVLYVITKRTINGSDVRHVERMASRTFTDLEDAYFVDDGGSVDGTNTTATTVTVSGGTTWGPADTLTLTASSGIFVAPPGTTDVGDAIVLTDGGSVYRLTILGTSSATVATARVDVVLATALRGVATTAWAWARDTVTGLTHLEGATVSILADGAVHPQRVVTSGAITLDRAAVKVHVGLPYQSDLQTLPAVVQADGFGQGRQKNVDRIWLRVYRSSGIFVGPTADKLVEAKQRTTEPYGSPPALKTDEIEIQIKPSWGSGGQVYVRQSDPLPLTVVSLTAQVAIGD